MFPSTEPVGTAGETKERDMNPTLTKMMMDERTREISVLAARSSGFGQPASHHNGTFARWMSTFRDGFVRRGGTSTHASSGECCPAI